MPSPGASGGENTSSASATAPSLAADASTGSIGSGVRRTETPLPPPPTPIPPPPLVDRDLPHARLLDDADDLANPLGARLVDAARPEGVGARVPAANRLE